LQKWCEGVKRVDANARLAGQRRFELTGRGWIGLARYNASHRRRSSIRSKLMFNGPAFAVHADLQLTLERQSCAGGCELHGTRGR
jgi:hypothetical protein